MLTPETIKQIESDAQFYVRYGKPKVKTKTEAKYLAYIAGATAYAAKLSQAEEENNRLKKENEKLHTALEEIAYSDYPADEDGIYLDPGQAIYDMKLTATEALKQQS